MALTVNVKKSGVSLRMPKMWAITLTLEILDGAEVVLTRTFTQNFKLGHSIPDLAAVFLAEMQATIEQYKSEQGVLSNAALDAVVTGLKTDLEV